MVGAKSAQRAEEGGVGLSAPTRVSETEFNPVYHHYGPHRAGLPPLIPYFRELWHRRTFAAEKSKADMRGQNTTTFFGQAWLVLNPLLLAGIYYLLVTIVRGEHNAGVFAHLMLCLFVFTMLQTAITTGSKSVTGSGKLLINTAFPRLLIPLSAVRTAFFRFLPTIPLYLIFHAIFMGNQWHPRMFLSLFFLGTIVVFSAGLAAFFAALQVYFRDTSQFLPYFVRLWMYISPVLWLPGTIGDTLPRPVAVIMELNPMYSMLTGYSGLIQGGTVPSFMWWSAAGWACASAVIGSLFFITREREFAVRLV